MYEIFITILLICGCVTSIFITLLVIAFVVWMITNSWADKINHGVLRLIYYITDKQMLFCDKKYQPRMLDDHSPDYRDRYILKYYGEKKSYTVYILTEEQLNKLKLKE